MTLSRPDATVMILIQVCIWFLKHFSWICRDHQVSKKVFPSSRSGSRSSVWTYWLGEVAKSLLIHSSIWSSEVLGQGEDRAAVRAQHRPKSWGCGDEWDWFFVHEELAAGPHLASLFLGLAKDQRFIVTLWILGWMKWMNEWMGGTILEWIWEGRESNV